MSPEPRGRVGQITDDPSHPGQRLQWGKNVLIQPPIVQVLPLKKDERGLPRLCGNDWVFQQDNTAVHNARLTKNFFQRYNVTLLTHPACSFDLNQIENICGWMQSQDIRTGLRLESLSP
uniref:Tc1-like transposase DDE domain-containing protein n=1 Tax=Periophthalmus magnuspinnatus TaxID=409849 RepID=A0A3B4BJS5_9GOBI